MPTPSKGEEQGHFISRCVSQVMHEGTTDDNKQAVAICYSMWRKSKGQKRAKLFCDAIKQQPGVPDVHDQTALGNQSERRRRQRRQAIREAAARAKTPDSSDVPTDTGTGAGKAWSIPIEIRKAEPERQMIFGWASVVAKNGQYVVDKQGDIIPIHELENAVLNYMLESRDHGIMHDQKGTGKLVMSFLTTPEYMDAFGLTQRDDQIGWIGGWKIEDPALWEAHKRGLLPELSIGGSSMPFEPVDEAVDLKVIDKARGRRLARVPFRRY